MTIHWPAALRFTAYSPPVLENSDRSGGVSLSGGEQIIVSPSGRWAMQVTTILRDQTTMLAWRALCAQFAGSRGAEILMPVTACLTQPGAILRTLFLETGGALTPFDDGLGFIEEQYPAALISDVSLNATVLNIGCDVDIQPGHYVGIRDRLYAVQSVSKFGISTFACTIAPWTRAAALAGDPVLLRTAVCRMRLRDPQQLQQPVDLGRFARPTLDFVEAF